MAYELGIKPDRLKIYLYRDADFDSALTRRDLSGVEIPWGTSDVRLVFPAVVGEDGAPDPVSWPGIVDGATTSFQVDKALTNLRSHGERVELWVAEQCWAAGKVDRKGVLS